MSKSVILKGRGVVRGKGIGKALISAKPISFFGDINPETGEIIAEDNPLKGVSIAGKVFIFPYGRGSTVGSYIIYRLKKAGKAPVAIVNVRTEPIIAVGCVIAQIPLVDMLDKNPIEAIPTGSLVEVDGTMGIVKIIRRKKCI